MNELWSLLVYAIAVAALVAMIVGVSHFLGERHRDRATGERYESGVAETGEPRGPFGAPFYLVAVLFVIFDLEVIFFFAWAVAARELGWSGYAGILLFGVILVIGLLYEWRQGVLDWGPAPAPSRRRREERAKEI